MTTDWSGRTFRAGLSEWDSTFSTEDQQEGRRVEFCLELKRLSARITFCRMSAAHLVEMNGFSFVLWWATYASMAATNSPTLVNTPWRSRLTKGCSQAWLNPASGSPP